MDKIRVAVKEAGKDLRVEEIEPILKNFKSLIGGGFLEGVYIGAGIMMYCDEEGKFQGLPSNFSLSGDTVVGDVVFFGYNGSELEQSLSDDQIEYLQYSLAENYLSILRSEDDLQFILKNKRERR